MANGDAAEVPVDTRPGALSEPTGESVWKQAHIKLSSFVSDLLGLSARRMLKALAEGETDPAVLAALADRRLRPRRNNCATHWVPVRNSMEFTAGC